MEFGLCVITKLDEVDIVVDAENLGFDSVWVPDSQMIWADCYAYLALAAKLTDRIRLGTGVSIGGTRIPPVTAHSIASINTLAPGRTFLGFGSGNSAHRLLDHKPLPIAKFGEELRVVRALLDGDEVDFTYRGKTTPIRLLMADQGYVNLDDRIPIYVSGFGPRSQALAGRYGDGLVTSVPPEERSVHRALRSVEEGAVAAGRDLDMGTFPAVTLTHAVVLESGEDLTSDRVMEECGAYVISSLHYLYDKIRQYGGEPPHHLQHMWGEYSALVEETPAAVRHMRIHDGHCTWLRDDEAKFVTPDLIRRTCIVGTPDEVVGQIGELEEAGITELMFLPSASTQRRFVSDFAAKVLPKVDR